MDLNKIAEQAVEAADGEKREAAPAAPEMTLDGMLESAASRMAHEPEKQEAAPAAPDGKSAEETKPEHEQKSESDKLQAPAHWSEEHRKAFEDLSPEGQRLFLERHKSMEGNLNRKHEELAEERNRLKAWESLVARIQGDPQFAQHVFAYGKPPEAAQAQPTIQQPPDDPIERLKWEAVQIAKDEMRRELQPILGQQQQTTAQLQMQTVISRAQADPLFGEIDNEVTRSILDAPIPEYAKRSFAEKLATDPVFYRDTFDQARAAVLRRRESDAAKAKEQPASKQAQPERTEKPRPVAPVLEGAGAADSALHGAAQRAKIQSLTKKIKANTAEPSDIGEYLEAVGAFGRMGL